MGKWEEVELGDITENLDGKRKPIKASERKTKKGGYPYYGASGVIDTVEDYIFDGDYLLISEDGANLLARTYPIAFIAKGKFWVNNHAHIVRGITGVTTNNYLEYYFSSIDISKYVTGSAQPKFNQKKLNSVKIPLPPLAEQKKIVAKLDELFERIDKSISLLEDNIHHTKDLMASVLDEEFSLINDDELTIKDLLEKTKTVNPKVEYKDSLFTYIDISSINKELHFLEDPKNIRGIDAPSRARKKVEKGDLIFATTRPNLKNIAIIQEDYNLPIASTGFCVLRVNKALIIDEFLFFYLISDKVQELIKPFIRGAQYPAISDKDLKSLSIPLPNIEKQEIIVEKIKGVQQKRNLLLVEQTKKLEHLKSLKSSLLDKAFKGELV